MITKRFIDNYACVVGFCINLRMSLIQKYSVQL